jgi:hypothetical protein
MSSILHGKGKQDADEELQSELPDPDVLFHFDGGEKRE